MVVFTYRYKSHFGISGRTSVPHMHHVSKVVVFLCKHSENPKMSVAAVSEVISWERVWWGGLEEEISQKTFVEK